jgi:hypothetical protein
MTTALAPHDATESSRSPAVVLAPEARTPPGGRDLVAGPVVTTVAQAELWASADRVEGPLTGHVLLNLPILPALAVRRVSPLGSALWGR